MWFYSDTPKLVDIEKSVLKDYNYQQYMMVATLVNGTNSWWTCILIQSGNYIETASLIKLQLAVIGHEGMSTHLNLEPALSLTFCDDLAI